MHPLVPRDAKVAKQNSLCIARGRQPFEPSVPFFDRVKIETSPRAKRLLYFPRRQKKVLTSVDALLSFEISVQNKKKVLISVGVLLSSENFNAHKKMVFSSVNVQSTKKHLNSSVTFEPTTLKLTHEFKSKFIKS